MINSTSMKRNGSTLFFPDFSKAEGSFTSKEVFLNPQLQLDNK